MSDEPWSSATSPRPFTVIPFTMFTAEGGRGERKIVIMLAKTPDLHCISKHNSKSHCAITSHCLSKTSFLNGVMAGKTNSIKQAA